MSIRPGARHVILYELNEVPWEIIDLYVRRNPSSNLASLLADGACQTTVNEDSHHLSPWCTWPTFHKALYSGDHNSHDLGQDPETLRGINIWDVAEQAGLTVGLFGVLQSWPPREFINGGFYVPDTFSQTPEAYPSEMVGFQEFNLAMTQRLGFSADAPLDAKAMVRAGLNIARRGLTPWSVYWILRQLLQERRDARYKASRSIIQALLAFDLYWTLHRKGRPELSIFFTNHVAGMLHRFWGDSVPEYAEQFGYQPDEVYRNFVTDAMDVFDHHLGRIMPSLRAHPETVMVVAASMGQAGIPYDHIGETYVLEDGQRLASALKLGPVKEGLNMYPRNSLEFEDVAAAERAVPALGSATCGSGPLISDISVDGRTVSFSVRLELDGAELSRDAQYGTADEPSEAKVGTIGELGIGTAARLGGGNTAYHMPEGPFIVYGEGVAPDQSRREMSVLQAAPTILDLLGIEDAESQLSPASSAVGSRSPIPVRA